MRFRDNLDSDQPGIAPPRSEFWRRMDTDASVEGLPLMLIVIVVVVALVVSSVTLYAISSDAQATETGLRSELLALVSRLKDVVDPTFSGSEAYTLTLREGAFTKIRSVALGGALGSPDTEDLTFRYVLSTGRTGSVLTDGVRVTTDSGALVLDPGPHDLLLERKVSSDASIGAYVQLSEV